MDTNKETMKITYQLITMTKGLIIQTIGCIWTKDLLIFMETEEEATDMELCTNTYTIIQTDIWCISQSNNNTNKGAIELIKNSLLYRTLTTVINAEILER